MSSIGDYVHLYIFLPGRHDKLISLEYFLFLPGIHMVFQWVELHIVKMNMVNSSKSDDHSRKMDNLFLWLHDVFEQIPLDARRLTIF